MVSGLGIPPLSRGASSFNVQDIEVQGLQRIEPGTVFTYLPVTVGDRFDNKRSAEVIRALFKTGFFSDISLRRRGNVLIVVVTERPAIADINFDGNNDISDDDLTTALKGVGIAKGRVFNRSILERLENELRQQYFARGKYNVQLEVNVNELPRNRVEIDINISEGQVAKIKRVNIVGNKDFRDKDLKEDFDSGLPAWYNFFSSKDEYSKQKLAGDLEKLRTHYLDRGYLKFNIDSTQVSITPDNRDIYITINITEGDKYTVSNVKLAGSFVVPEEELETLLVVKSGDIFSRKSIVETTDKISQRLGQEGYAFAQINPIPEVDDAKKNVSLTFFIDPGQRVYVRRINFTGNYTTRDEVFRREMRQMEGGWYSLKNIELSRKRLQRLPYVESVDIKTTQVANIDDQVDLDINIKERRAGSFSVGAGFSQAQGLLFNLSLSQDNFMGTGNRVSVRFDNSRISQIYSFSYTNPYFTIDGVSLGLNISYTETDRNQADVSNFKADQFSGSINSGIPLTEVDTLRVAFGGADIDLTASSDASDEVLKFIDDNGSRYLNFSLTGSFIHDTRNRTVFADRGNLQRVNLEVTIPGSDLTYYKMDYRFQQYIPILKWLTGSFNSQVAYGDDYGDTSDLPFFEKYFAGGIRTVRGYKSNRIGPRDSNGDAFGGNFRVIGNFEFLFPPPFANQAENIRMSAFLDAGSVYANVDDFSVDKIRLSVGMGMTWLSPVGALTFSLAQAFNDQPQDELESFQFSIGTAF